MIAIMYFRHLASFIWHGIEEKDPHSGVCKPKLYEEFVLGLLSK